MKWPILPFQNSAAKGLGMFLRVGFPAKSVDTISRGGPGDDGTNSKMGLSRWDFLTARFVCDKDGARMAAMCRPPHLGAFHATEFMALIVVIHDAHAINRLDRDTVERAPMSFLLASQAADNGKAHRDENQPKHNESFMKGRHDYTRESSTDIITNEAR